jgi:LuxR family transcriptional regulator of csgAB operon
VINFKWKFIIFSSGCFYYSPVYSKQSVCHLSERNPVGMVTLQNINKPLAQRLPKDSVILFDIAVSNKN